MKSSFLTAAAAALVLGAGGVAIAQQPPAKGHDHHQPAARSGQDHQHMQHGAGMMMKGDMSVHGGPAGRDYMQAMHDMHQKMMQAQDRDPDRAFAFKMIEHHRGGVAMAEVLQKHGDDAELKKMAAKMAEEQKKDIAELQSWLDRHGGRTPKK